MSRAAKVLLVEDKVLVRGTLQGTLHGFHCEFSDAPDGATALELLARSRFDVIFLDLKLPDIPGLEVLARARSRGIAHGSFFVLTGHPDKQSRVAAKRLGVVRYLTKDPINPKEIRAAVASVVPSAVTLEATRDRTVRTDRVSKARPPRDRRRTDAARPRILVLDDKQIWLDSIASVLGEDFNLTLTTSPMEAWRHVRRRSYALVVLDMKLLEGVSGLDVLARMRKAIPDLRAIILAADPDFDEAFESAQRRALAYVDKSKLKTLPERIKAVLAEKAKPVEVFLSYEKTDRPRVARVYKKLMATGQLPWMDCKNIVGATEWEPEILKAIARTDYFVFFASSHSIAKRGVMMREVNRALARQEEMLPGEVFFIVARLEKCAVPPPLQRFQFVDLFRRDGFEQLLRALAHNRSNGED